ncbi:lysophospholipid acyltransferase family protein [Pseudomonadota bacterium]
MLELKFFMGEIFDPSSLDKKKKYVVIAVRGFAKGVMYSWQNIQIEGLEKLDNLRGRPYVLLAKHQSKADIALEAILLEKVGVDAYYIMKASLTKNPVSKWILEHCGGIPIVRMKDLTDQEEKIAVERKGRLNRLEQIVEDPETVKSIVRLSAKDTPENKAKIETYHGDLEEAVGDYIGEVDQIINSLVTLRAEEKGLVQAGKEVRQKVNSVMLYLLLRDEVVVFHPEGTRCYKESSEVGLPHLKGLVDVDKAYLAQKGDPLTFVPLDISYQDINGFRAKIALRVGNPFQIEDHKTGKEEIAAHLAENIELLTYSRKD